MGSDKVYTQAEVDGLMMKAYEQGVLAAKEAIVNWEELKGNSDEGGVYEFFKELDIPIPNCSGGKCGK
jgi:hypothetical protein